MPHTSRLLIPQLVAALLFCLALPDAAPGQLLAQSAELDDFFEHEVSRIERETNLSTRYKSLKDWETDRPVLRLQLFDMLGRAPLP